MPKCDFNKVALLHIFRTPFLKNTCGWLLLKVHSFFTPFLKFHEKVNRDSKTKVNISKFYIEPAQTGLRATKALAASFFPYK